MPGPVQRQPIDLMGWALAWSMLACRALVNHDDIPTGASAGRPGSLDGGFRRGLYPYAKLRNEPGHDYCIILGAGIVDKMEIPEARFPAVGKSPIARPRRASYTAPRDG